MQTQKPVLMGQAHENHARIEIGSIGGKNRIGPAMGHQTGKHTAFDRHILEHRLDHQIGIGQSRHVGISGHTFDLVFGLQRADASAYHRALVNARQIGQAALESWLVLFDQDDGQSGIAARRRNPCPHRAAADHPDRADGTRRDSVQFGRAGSRPLAEKHMTQGRGLPRAA